MNLDLKTPCYSVPYLQLAVFILFICLFLALPQAAYGDNEPAGHFPEGFPLADARHLENLENILASPDFGGEREGWEIRLKDRDRREIPEMDIEPWLERIRQIFGYILRGLVVISIAFLTGFAVYWYLRNRQKWRPRFRDGGKNYVNPLFSPEDPQTLFARAEDCFYRGYLREAWAACLAGCLGAYKKYRSLSFPSDATEYGCLDLVRRALPAEAGGFGELVRSWILFAYGGRAPGEGAFEKALSYGRSLLVQPSTEGLK